MAKHWKWFKLQTCNTQNDIRAGTMVFKKIRFFHHLLSCSRVVVVNHRIVEELPLTVSKLELKLLLYILPKTGTILSNVPKLYYLKHKHLTKCHFYYDTIPLTGAFFIDMIRVVTAFSTKEISDKRYLKKRSEKRIFRDKNTWVEDTSHSTSHLQYTSSKPPETSAKARSLLADPLDRPH